MAESDMENVLKPTFFFLCAFLILSISTVSFSQQPDPYLPYAEVMPQPVGGMAEIYKKIDYPESTTPWCAG